jgi:hypothetical protein
MWEQYAPQTDSILCLEPERAQAYPLGTRAIFNDVEFAVARRQPIRDAGSQEVKGFFIYFKPVGHENVESDS